MGLSKNYKFLILIPIPVFCSSFFANGTQSHGSMGFTENKGQIVDMDNNLRPDILFVGDGGSMKTYLRKTGISYVLYSEEGKVESDINKNDNHHGVSGQSSTINLHRIDMDFVDMNTDFNIKKAGKADNYTNYFLGHCPQGIMEVNSYTKVVFENIYDNIDIIFYGSKERGLKYDIVVRPGGDPEKIKLKYSGADDFEIKNSELKIKHLFGELIENMPKVYQHIDEKIVDIKAEYELEGTTLNFKFETFNLQYPLIIDPWVTYYGGSSAELSGDIATDTQGNPIAVGTSMGIAFPVTPGAYQISNAGIWDAYILKMTSSGGVAWATYFGGNGMDEAHDVCTDKFTNDIVVTGSTFSTNMPVTVGAFQTSNGGGKDAFVCKLSSTGNLLWSTYYGGTAMDPAYSITTDLSANVLIAGYTTSSNFPTQAAFQSSLSASSDGFAVKFDNSGNRIWATYFGGNREDQIFSISTDASGNALIGGFTKSTNLPITPGAFQTTKKGTIVDMDAFVAKLSSSNSLVWCTFYGGNGGIDIVYDIAADNLSNVIIGGQTTSSNLPVSAGAYKTSLMGSTNSDAFVTKFNSGGTFIWGTYWGGSDREEDVGIATDASNNVYVFGDTYSNDFPVTSCAYQTIFGGQEDQFISKLDAAGNLLCSGYLGGTLHDELPFSTGGGVAVNGSYVYLHAHSSGSYPTTLGSYQPNHSGGAGADAIIAQLCALTCGLNKLTVDFNASKNTICTNEPVSFTSLATSCDLSGSKWFWSFPGATPATSTDINPTGITYASTGNYDVKLVIKSPCGEDSVHRNSYIYVFKPSVTLATQNTSCFGSADGSASANVSGGNPPYNYAWTTTPPQNTSTATALSAGTYSLNISDNNGCKIDTSVSISQPLQLQVSTAATTAVCKGQSTTISVSTTGGTGTYTYAWQPSGPLVSPSVTTTYSVVVTDSNNCISLPDSIKVIVNSLPVVSFAANDTTGCAPLCVNLSNTSTGAVSSVWDLGDGKTANTFNATHCYDQSGTYSVTLIITDANNCIDSLIKNNYIHVYPSPIASFLITPNQGITPGSSVQFKDNSTGANQWTWSFGDVNSSTSSVQHSQFTYSNTGSYTIILTVRNEYGCTDTSVRIIQVDEGFSFYVPNTFTPNGDGVNDLFLPKEMGVNNSYNELLIYDRWGNLIFKSNDGISGWDGKVEGGNKIAQVDTYVWEVNLKDVNLNKRRYVGHINLVK